MTVRNLGERWTKASEEEEEEEEGGREEEGESVKQARTLERA